MRFLAAPVHRARRRRAAADRRLLRASSATATSPASARRCCEVGRRARRRCPTTRPATSRRMVHAAVGYARSATGCRRCACTTSIGPGATNMVTGAALATINRLPVLLLPGDIFATRVANPVLQQLEDPRGYDVSRQRRVPAGVALLRPDQPARAAARGAARGDAGAHRPGRDRRGHPRPAAGRAGRGVRLAGGAVRRAGVARRPAGARARRAGPRGRGDPRRAAAADRRRRRRASTPRPPRRCAAFAEATGIPVAETQAGKGSLPYDHPQAVGGDRRHRHRRPPTRWPARPTW